MRSLSDRLRHAISFEIFALMMVVPLGALLFDMPIGHIGVVGVVSSLIATLWNMIYNLLFDLGLNRATGTTRKSGPARALHAVLFEASLLAVLMPFFAWYLGVSLWQALVMDASFALFYVVYGYGFNWVYDRLFPLPEWQQAAVGGLR